MNNQISNNTVLKTQINSRSKRAKRFRRKRERKSSKRESESSSSDNSNPPNHESYQSSIANFHVLPYSPPAPMPPSRIPLIIGWRKGQADCSLAGNRIPVASSISGCEPSFPPESRGEFGSVAWFRGGWGTWRVIEGVRARFNPSPTANFHGLWARKSTRGRNYRTNLI